MKYIIGLTQYDQERELYFTHVGSKDLQHLIYSVYGKTESISKERAINLVELLNAITVHVA